MKRWCARASDSIASRDPARASETRFWSLLSSYSSDKGCIIELSKLQQIGAKFNFTDEAKEGMAGRSPGASRHGRAPSKPITTDKFAPSMRLQFISQRNWIRAGPSDPYRVKDAAARHGSSVTLPSTRISAGGQECGRFLPATARQPYSIHSL